MNNTQSDRPRILAGFSQSKAPEANLGASSIDELEERIQDKVVHDASVAAKSIIASKSFVELPVDLIPKTGTLRHLIDFWRDYNEAPDIFLLAAAIQTVAVAAGAGTYLEDGDGKIYPNSYFALVGPSSIKKSTAAGLPFRLAQALGLHPFSFPRCTGESLFGLVGGLKHKDGQITIPQTFGLWNVDELSELTAYLDRDFNSNLKAGLLTAFDGGRVELFANSYGLRSANFQGLSIVAATTLSRMKFSREDYFSGWFARWFFWPTMFPSSRCIPFRLKPDQDRLEDLATIMTQLREGRIMTFDTSAISAYDKWYREDCRVTPPEILGSSWIRHRTYIKKFAMVAALAAGRSNVNNEDVYWGIGLIKWQRANVNCLVQEEKATVFEQRKDRLLAFLVERGGCATKREVCREMTLRATDLDDLIRFAKDAGLLTETARANPGTRSSTIYALIDNPDKLTERPSSSLEGT